MRAQALLRTIDCMAVDEGRPGQGPVRQILPDRPLGPRRAQRLSVKVKSPESLPLSRTAETSFRGQSLIAATVTVPVPWKTRARLMPLWMSNGPTGVLQAVADAERRNA